MYQGGEHRFGDFDASDVTDAFPKDVEGLSDALHRRLLILTKEIS
jgi:hypothetical protein